jgi:hypothetical protein
MSRENVEVVRNALRLWGLDPDGGLQPIDLDRMREIFEGDTTAAGELFDPEVEIHPPEGAVGGSLQRGYDVRDGRIARMEVFARPDGALEAASAP